MIKEYKLNIFADYFQFYIQDESVDGDLGEYWTAEALHRFLAIKEGIIGVGTVRNMEVPVSVSIFKDEPSLQDDDNINQINECDLIVTSSKIVIAGSTEYFPNAKRIELGNGIYRVRIYYGNLDKLEANGLEGEDFYRIHMWLKNEPKELQIIKDYIKQS